MWLVRCKYQNNSYSKRLDLLIKKLRRDDRMAGKVADALRESLVERIDEFYKQSKEIIDDYVNDLRREYIGPLLTSAQEEDPFSINSDLFETPRVDFQFRKMPLPPIESYAQK